MQLGMPRSQGGSERVLRVIKSDLDGVIRRARLRFCGARARALRE
jgi:hypothetical protein